MTAASPADENPVRLTPTSPVALIEIDNPPVNATSQAVRAGLLAAIHEVDRNPQIEAVVIACAGRTFVAGADIREFGQPPREPHLPDVIDAIEACSKPVVAAVHGTALGGGCEIALACHARIADPGASFGLPEVKLGLVPGAGGTQRLPRLIGLEAALDLVSSGRMVKAAEALRLGLVDRLSSGDLRQDAMELARELIGKPIRRTGEQTIAGMDSQNASAKTAEIRRKARGAEAPGKAAELVLLAADLPLKEGMARERETFLALRSSEQSAALRHAFFAEREVTRLPGFDAVEPRPVQKVGIVGAGTMGSGIAIAFADAGFDVKVVETSEQALAAGEARITDNYDRQVASGRLTAAARDERLRAITYAVGIETLSDRDLVIEAVFEDLEVKRALFRDLDAILKPGTILATNTSYLDISLIAAATSRPARCGGAAFLQPGQRDEASRNRADRCDGRRCRRHRPRPRQAPAQDPGGLPGLRRLRRQPHPIALPPAGGVSARGRRAAARGRCGARGLRLPDGAVCRLGHGRPRHRLGTPQAPCAATAIRNERYVDIADRLCEAGRFGRKTGAGWYRYEGGKREIDPSVTSLVEEASQRRGLTRRRISAEEIQARIRAAIVNEACKILDERIVERPLDVDVVMMHGYGYPAWRGGPLFEADRIGLQPILAQVKERAERDGPGWEVAEGLVRRAASNAKFYP